MGDNVTALLLFRDNLRAEHDVPANNIMKIKVRPGETQMRKMKKLALVKRK